MYCIIIALIIIVGWHYSYSAACQGSPELATFFIAFEEDLRWTGSVRQYKCVYIYIYICIYVYTHCILLCHYIYIYIYIYAYTCIYA